MGKTYLADVLVGLEDILDSLVQVCVNVKPLGEMTESIAVSLSGVRFCGNLVATNIFFAKAFGNSSPPGTREGSHTIQIA